MCDSRNLSLQWINLTHFLGIEILNTYTDIKFNPLFLFHNFEKIIEKKGN